MPMILNGTGDITGLASVNSSVTAAEIGYLDGTTSAIQTQFNNIGVWQNWTPTWTNLTVGAGGSVTARYCQINKIVVGYINFVYGAGSAVSGDVYFSLPVVTTASNRGTAPIGDVVFLDSGVATYSGMVRYFSTTAAQIIVENASTTYLSHSVISATIPFTFGTADAIQAYFIYEAA